ncbi:RNA-binding S4 domain-containing protein [Ensifer soli]|uniref:RNA-binding S4 domain-containing protein n=1 Tax=Ciceribacter sp. sgz301302 TaxID=3342379 RepID=UPI0035B8CF26
MADDAPGPAAVPRQRLDKWLFFVRMVKSRSLAQKAIEAGDVRVNGTRATSASFQVKIGDEVSVSLRERAVLLRVLSGGTRRGPYPEARHLYEDLTPPPDAPASAGALPHASRVPGAGRPEKKERREIARLLSPAWWQQDD